MNHEFLFVGLGSNHGDDRIGWLVADALCARNDRRIAVRNALVPLDLLDWLDPAQRLALCDACWGLESPGSWRRWTWPTVDARLRHASGTHDFGISRVLELAGRLGRLAVPPLLWGIEIEQCAPGSRVSQAVADAVPEVVRHVILSLESASSEQPVSSAPAVDSIPSRH